MEIEKSKVLIQFLLIFRQSGDVFFFLYARRLRGYTATITYKILQNFPVFQLGYMAKMCICLGKNIHSKNDLKYFKVKCVKV